MDNHAETGGPPGQMRLTEEARVGLDLPLGLGSGDCSPADEHLDQCLRHRIDFLARVKRKEDAAGGWHAEWSVIGIAPSVPARTGIAVGRSRWRNRARACIETDNGFLGIAIARDA